MSGHYLPLATIAWCLSINYTMANTEALGKYDGLLGVPALNFFGIDLNQGRSIYYLIWALALLGAWALINLLDSRAGRAIRALKSGSVMAEAMGISTYRYKVIIFVIAALYAAVSGWLFAHFQRTVNPSPFGIKMGIEYLFMAVVGGVGHVWGAFTGSAVVKLVEDQLQVWLPKLIGTSGNYEIIVFGIALVLALKYAPDGLWPGLRGMFARLLPAPVPRADWQGALALPARDKPAAGELLLEAKRGAQDLRRSGGRQRRQLLGPRRRDHRPDRPQRRRQEHHLQPGLRRAGPERRRGALSRPARRRPAARARSRGAGSRAPSSMSS